MPNRILHMLSFEKAVSKMLQYGKHKKSYSNEKVFNMLDILLLVESKQNHAKVSPHARGQCLGKVAKMILYLRILHSCVPI